MSDKPKRHEGLPPGLAGQGDWYISEFTNEEEGLIVRGRFQLTPFAKLSQEQMHFLTTFLRCRGVISSVEKELGISYPTVRARLDALLLALDLAPTGDMQANGRRSPTDRQKDILERLEKGEITAEEAKAQMKETGN